MINDGYTQHGGFDQRRFSYRPALHSERVEFMRRHKTLANVSELINRHVVWKDGMYFEEEQKVLFLICFGVWPPQFGGDWALDWEQRDSTNLYEGVILELRHPQVAKRDCAKCKRWWYDEDTGRIATKGGRKLLRPLDVVTLCETNEGCPKGTPENQRGLSEKNRQAWRHFQECEAVRWFPDDPIVRHNARIIRRAMKEAKQRA